MKKRYLFKGGDISGEEIHIRERQIRERDLRERHQDKDGMNFLLKDKKTQK